PRALTPVSPGQRVQHRLLRYLGQGLLDPPLRQRGGHPALVQALADAEPPLAPRRHPAPREAGREAGVVQVALGPQTLQRPLHLPRGVTPLQEGPPELVLAVIPTGETAEGTLVSAGRGLVDLSPGHPPPPPPARGPRGSRQIARAAYSMSNDCMVFSIS